jgi:hypothetical protein
MSRSSADMNTGRLIGFVTMEINPVWLAPQNCRHRLQGDFVQPTQPWYLMKLTLAITWPQGGKGETRTSWWRVWCMALFCGQSAIAAGGVYRAIQQKTDNAACEQFLNFTMPRNWLRDTCSQIPVPIVFTSMSDQDASSLFDQSDQISPLHGMTNSPTLRAPKMCPPERSR